MIYTSRFVKYIVWTSSEGQRVVEDVLTLCCAVLHGLLLNVEALFPVVESCRAEAFSDLLAVEDKVAIRVGFHRKIHLKKFNYLLLILLLLNLRIIGHGR